MVKISLTLITFMTVFALGIIAGTFYDNKEAVQSQANKKQVIVTFPESQSSATSNALTEDQNFSVEAALAHDSVYQILRHTYTLTDQMTPAELQQFSLDAATTEIGSLRNNLISISLRRLVELDPQSTLEFVHSNSTLDDRLFLNQVIANWMFMSPTEAVDYVANLDAGPMQTQLAYRLIGEARLKDHGLNLRLEKIIGPRADKWVTQKKLNQALPSEAFDIALNLSNKRDQRQHLHNAVNRWVSSEPEMVFSKILQIEDQDLRYSLMQSIFLEYIAYDTNAAILFLSQHEFDGHVTKNSLLQLLAREAPLQTLGLVEAEPPGQGKANVLGSLLRAWASTEPLQAIAYIDAMEQNPQQLSYYQAAYSSYLAKDPEAALDWIASRFDDNRPAAISALSQSISENTIEHALNLLETTDHEGIRSALLPAIANYKAASSHEGATEWLYGFRNNPGYESALLGMVYKITQESPEKAAASIAPVLNSKLVDQYVGYIAQKWYEQDREASILWVQSLPNANAKDAALTSIIHQVYSQDPDLAVSYLRQIETPFKKDDVSLFVATGYLQRGVSVEKIIQDLQLSDNAAARVRDAARQIPPQYRP